MSDDYRFGVDILHEVLDALGLSGAKGCTQRLIIDFGEKEFPIIHLQYAPTAEALEQLKAIEGLDLVIPSEGEMRALFGTVGQGMHTTFILKTLERVLDKAHGYRDLHGLVKREREELMALIAETDE